MSFDRELLEQYIDEVHSLKEAIREEFLRSSNPGLPAVFREIKLALRALEDCENLLDGLTVKG